MNPQPDSPDSTEVEPFNVPTQEKIDYIYAFLKKYEPVLDDIVEQIPGFLDQLSGLAKNPMLKMLFR